jgi:hypothetical protein
MLVFMHNRTLSGSFPIANWCTENDPTYLRKARPPFTMTTPDTSQQLLGAAASSNLMGNIEENSDLLQLHV